MKRTAALALVAIGLATACVPDEGRPDRTAELYGSILEAEDARPAEGDPRLATLLNATELESPMLRRVAVRALGRLERPELAEAIAPRLADGSAEVRAAAAEALAQSVHGVDGSTVLELLLERVPEEHEGAAMGALARALGSLRLDRADRRRVEEALVSLGERSGDSDEALEGVALGFESLTRLSGGEGIGRPAADLLDTLVSFLGSAHVRAMAAEALGRSRRLTLELTRSGLTDEDPEVRRVVIGYLDAVPLSLREPMIAQALADTSVRVSIAAVRYLAAETRTDPRCEQLLAAAGTSRPPALRVVALEALARPCPTPGPQRATLVEAVSEIDEAEAAWQPAARALLSLGAIDTDAADGALPPFASHPSPFVRAYAARAASATHDVETLFALAVDSDPNVRNEAVQGLFAVEGHGLDDFLSEQLASDDPQLLITIAGLLAGAPDRRGVAERTLAAFERISGARRETWRDPRLALLTRVKELGDASLAERLSPYLHDYDVAVATEVAGILEAWTGREQVPEPEPLPPAPVPGLGDVRALGRATLTLTLEGGGRLTVALRADEAPTNVARLARLADSGYYDGLTFHRWAPNFVIQGGSPHANEYQGDGPYTRDEVGGVHWRGTVGLSTRGRDTGDGQIFVNLVNNPRLDADYTVMGELVEGDDILDTILEGAVIERVDLGLQP